MTMRCDVRDSWNITEGTTASKAGTGWPTATLLLVALGLVVGPVVGPALAYPPSVGITSPARNCLVCHVDNGPWKDDGNTIIDILDRASGESLRQEDGSFVVAAKRGETKTIVTVIGRSANDDAPRPYRNGWLYVDPERIKDAYSLSAFAPGWEVNLPAACRLVGDASPRYPGASITVLPMKVRPGADARDAVVELQAMLTMGESVKGKPQEGLVANYYERNVQLKVIREETGVSGASSSGFRVGGATPVAWLLLAIVGAGLALPRLISHRGRRSNWGIE